VKRRALGISSSLVLVALAIAALWLWRSRAPADSAAAHSTTPRASEHPALAAKQQGPATNGGEVASPQQASPELQSQPVRRRPAPDDSGQRPLTPEERERFRDQIAPFQKAWDEHIAPLLYPPGHPLEGDYLDSVTCDQAVEARLAYYEELNPPGYLDAPQLHIRKRFNFYDINHRAQTWDRTDPASTREFYDWMVSQPEDPNGRLADMWLDADPSDRDAITRREFRAKEIRARETSICGK
jgi:hypothetical protein